MASVVQLSAQDKKDLEKFTKFLALKSVQIIVQSRLGEKVHTKCNPQTSGTDWFNLAIKDLPEVVTEAKRAMYSGSSRLPLCVEISLRTVEGDTMTLETWCVGVLPELADPSARVTYTVYNRMGILLKSLVAVTRVTPAYKLSRRQGPDTYVICYRIYMGDPQLHSLGEGYNQKRVGQLSTPVGTLHLSVAYRTKMTISPQQSGKDTSIMLKSDHFRPDFSDSPKHDYKPQQSEETQQCSLSETVKHGAFADSKAVSVLKGKLVVDDVPPCPLLFPMVLAQPVTVPPLSTTPPQAAEDDNANLTPHNVSIGSHNDDFIMVDLKTPFSNTNIELNLFYRECQSAPPLQGLAEEVTLEQQVGDLARQLEQFETSLHEFDNVVTTLCNADNNN